MSVNTNDDEQKPYEPVALLDILTNHKETNSTFTNTKEEFDRFYDLITRILVFDPRVRITPSAALDHEFFSQPKQTQNNYQKM